MYLILLKDRTGSDYHRLIVPYNQLMREKKIKGRFAVLQSPAELKRIKLKQYKAIIINGCIFYDPVKNVDALRIIRSEGVKLIVDIDDNFTLSTSHKLYYYYQYYGITKAIITAIKCADVITVANQNLWRHVKKKTGRKSVIVANAIDANEEQFNLEGNTFTDKVAYVGAAVNVPELWHIRQMIIDAQKVRPFTFFVCGYNAIDDGWIRLKREYKRIGVVAEYEDAKSVTDYADFYKDKGIIIAPLRRTYFNVCKSELKLIEAGYFSKAVLCARTTNYKDIARDGVNCITYEDNLTEGLLYLLSNREKAIELGKQLKADITAQFDLRRENERRLKALAK